MRSVSPIELELRTPRVWRGLIALSVPVATGGAWQAGWSAAGCVAVAAVATLAATLAWRETARWVGARLSFDSGGGLVLGRPGREPVAVEVERQVRLGRLLVLGLRTRGGQRIRLPVWPDMLDAEGFRRLLVRVERRHPGQPDADGAA